MIRRYCRAYTSPFAFTVVLFTIAGSEGKVEEPNALDFGIRQRIPEHQENWEKRGMGRSTRGKEKKKNNSSNNNKSTTRGIPAFEFCKVCKLNHNQGQKHKYFQSHTKAIASLLSRFRHKLSEFRFFLKNPAPLRPEHAEQSRLWCVFCDSDVSDEGSSFACENVIHHLAGEEHLENLNKFLRKHGGGMDRVDSFSVSKVDLIKWKKKCEVIGCSAQSSNGTDGGSLLASIDIQFQIKSSCTDNLGNNIVDHFTPIFSSGVVPLQSLTNEWHLLSHAKVSRDGNGTLVSSVGGASSSLASVDRNLGSQGKSSPPSIIRRLAVESDCKPNLLSSSQRLAHDSSSNEVELRTFLGMDRVDVNACLEDPQKLLQLSAKEKNSFIDGVSLSAQVRKPRKLNPERVGAAWAEKRREQLEMENRGEIVLVYDPGWLPNYGGVWQAGTRKEFRKAFENEKRKGSKIDQQTETPVKIQPYISKRMRLLSNGGEDSVGTHVD